MLELIVYGIVLGSIISLGAIGLTLVFGIIRFANFAHGDLMSTGAYIVLFMVTGLLAWVGIPDDTFGSVSFSWRMVIAFPVSMVVVGAVAIALDRILYRKLRQKGSGAVILAMSSLGAAFILRMIILILWGSDSLFYRPGMLRPALELPLGIKIRPDQILILAVVCFLVGLLHIFLQKSKMGKAMRATADNKELALVSGIDTERVIILTWGIGGALAAAGGILYGIDVQETVDYYRHFKLDADDISGIWRDLELQYPGVRYRFYEPDTLPFDAGFFDAVIYYAALEHMPKNSALVSLRQSRRVLTNDGRLFVFRCPNKISPCETLAKLLSIPCHDILYDEGELKGLIQKSGFHLLDFKNTDLFPAFLPMHIQGLWDMNGVWLLPLQDFFQNIGLRKWAHHFSLIAGKHHLPKKETVETPEQKELGTCV